MALQHTRPVLFHLQILDRLPSWPGLAASLTGWPGSLRRSGTC